VAFCPYASRTPFEIAIYPSFQSHDFGRCQTHDFWQLAEILREILARLHASLDDPPFNMLLISAPIQEDALRWPTVRDDFRWHIEILPRLSIFAGFEMATGCFINTVTPEEAARHLRQVQFPK
jgi:UDPglucose--hexose-1-phosphate uridylyltransferase